MRIGLPSQLQLRSSLPMLRVWVLLAAARAFRPPEWPAGERDALPPLGLNASWLADRVAGGQTFVARAGPLGDRAAELAFLRSHLLAPFHKHAATATATTAALALKGGDGSRAAAPVSALSLRLPPLTRPLAPSPALPLVLSLFSALPSLAVRSASAHSRTGDRW